MTINVADLITRAYRHLDDHARISTDAPSRAAERRAARHLHDDLAALVPLLQEAMADRDRLAAQLNTARRDPLTGLLTRDGWTKAAERLAAARPTAIILCDLDGFKPVNDRHGHAAGDAVLAATARRLVDWCEGSGVAGRLGGDEFVVATDERGGDLIKRTAVLRKLLARPIDYCGRRLQVSASVGAAALADLPAPTVSAGLEAADTAMYHDKRRGRRGRHWTNPLRLTHPLRAAS